MTKSSLDRKTTKIWKKEFMIKNRLRRAVGSVEDVQRLNEVVDKLANSTDEIRLTSQTKKLKEDLVNQEIEHKKQQEEWDKKQREITHMVGLQKQRGEQELELAKKAAEQERVAAVKEAELAVREGNLNAERELLKKQIDSLTDDLHKQINYLKEEVLSTVIKAVPNFNVDMVLDPHGSRDRAAERKALAKGRVVDGNSE